MPKKKVVGCIDFADGIDSSNYLVGKCTLDLEEGMEKMWVWSWNRCHQYPLSSPLPPKRCCLSRKRGKGERGLGETQNVKRSSCYQEVFIVFGMRHLWSSMKQRSDISFKFQSSLFMNLKLFFKSKNVDVDRLRRKKFSLSTRFTAELVCNKTPLGNEPDI